MTITKIDKDTLEETKPQVKRITRGQLMQEKDYLERRLSEIDTMLAVLK